MRKGLAARRSLVFDECDQNDPPSKRQARSEKVQYKVLFNTILLYFIKVFHSFIFVVL